MSESLHDRARVGPVYGFGFVEPELVSVRDMSAVFEDISVLYSLVAVASLRERPADEYDRLWQYESWPVPPEYQLYVHRVRYESPLLFEAGLLYLIHKVPDVVRRFTAAIEDVADLPDRIVDNRGKRREAKAEREEAAREREEAQRKREEAARERAFKEEEREEQRRKWRQEREKAEREEQDSHEKADRARRAQETAERAARAREAAIRAQAELRQKLEEGTRQLRREDVDRVRREVDEAIEGPDAALDDLYEALGRDDNLIRNYELTKVRLFANPVQINYVEVFEWIDEVDGPPNVFAAP